MPHPFIPVTDVASAQLCFTQDSQQLQNVFHYKFTAGGMTAGDMTTLAGALKTAWDVNLKGVTHSSVNLVKIIITNLTAQNSPGIEYVTGLPIAGTLAGNMLPSNVSIAVKWTTGYRGRSYRGRTYHIGLSDNWQSNNVIFAANQLALKNSYAAFLAATPAGWEMGVVSLMHDLAWRGSGVFTPITGCSVDATFDSQRRRLPGRGK